MPMMSNPGIIARHKAEMATRAIMAAEKAERDRRATENAELDRWERYAAMEADEQLSAIQLIARKIAVAKARDRFLDFVKFTTPNPAAPNDAEQTAYIVKKHHEAIARVLEEVEKGEMRRLIVTLPPRAGKSELVSRKFPAWFLGRNPQKSFIFGTYNDEFATEFGAEVRFLMRSPYYQQVFPGIAFRRGEQAAGRQKLQQGGSLYFAGRGTAMTGRGADLIVLDDLLKDRIEADSEIIRKQTWDWFNSVVATRQADDKARIVIVTTRWHEDDLVGRLTDPQNVKYNEVEADKWMVINIPAIAKEDDPLGRAQGELLWPERFPQEELDSHKRRDARMFYALYQQSPTVEDGDLFKREFFRYVKTEHRPEALRMYCASDHAVSSDGDYTAIVTIGVDRDDNIWVVDVWRRRANALDVVEQMIRTARTYRPVLWWAEKGHISKALGPFLRKRMAETTTYFAVHEQTPSKDKPTRSMSIRGRLEQGKVIFPTHAPWLVEFESELLKFPFGTHDDQVDALAYIGLGLDLQSRASAAPKRSEAPRFMTLGWVKQASVAAAAQAAQRGNGW